MLTEEDLLFLKENVKEGTISGESDYIDDFRGLGLMYEVLNYVWYRWRNWQ